MAEKEKFLKIVDNIYGFYLDATTGLREMQKNFVQIQENISNASGIPIDELDKQLFAYTQNNELRDQGIWQHETTQSQLKERNKLGGENHKILGHSCVVQINEYWNNHYRKLIASEIGIKEEELKINIFGDLRLLRNAILKNKGRAEFVSKMKLIKKFIEGQEITFDGEEFHDIILEIYKAIKGL